MSPYPDPVDRLPFATPEKSAQNYQGAMGLNWCATDPSLLRIRRDGTGNGVRIRRLKDKLGVRSVASGEVGDEAIERFPDVVGGTLVTD